MSIILIKIVMLPLSFTLNHYVIPASSCFGQGLRYYCFMVERGAIKQRQYIGLMGKLCNMV